MKPRSWLPHVALILIAVALCVRGRVTHVATQTARDIAFDAGRTTDERIQAMHLVANRARERDAGLGDELVRAFLASEDERLREAALMIDLSRHAIKPDGAPNDASPPLQSAYVYAKVPSGEWSPHRLRSYVLFRRKVGGSKVGGVRRMELNEARWFLDTLRGVALPPKEEINAYIKNRFMQPAAFRRGR